MRCPICDRDIDSLSVRSEAEGEGCPLCRALTREGADEIRGADLAAIDSSYVAAESATPVARRAIQDAFNWY